jgi:hypothetical protein
MVFENLEKFDRFSARPIFLFKKEKDDLERNYEFRGLFFFVSMAFPVWSGFLALFLFSQKKPFKTKDDSGKGNISFRFFSFKAMQR